MAILDDLLAQAGGNVDIGALAAKFGIDPAQARNALDQVLPQIADPGVDNGEAVAAVADRTGLDAGALMAMLPQLMAALQGSGAGQGGMLGDLLAGMRGSTAGGGIVGQVAGMLDRDGDGNPINDIMGMLGRT